MVLRWIDEDGRECAARFGTKDEAMVCAEGTTRGPGRYAGLVKLLSDGKLNLVGCRGSVTSFFNPENIEECALRAPTTCIILAHNSGATESYKSRSRPGLERTRLL